MSSGTVLAAKGSYFCSTDKTKLIIASTIWQWALHEASTWTSLLESRSSKKVKHSRNISRTDRRADENLTFMGRNPSPSGYARIPTATIPFWRRSFSFSYRYRHRHWSLLQTPFVLRLFDFLPSTLLVSMKSCDVRGTPLYL